MIICHSVGYLQISHHVGALSFVSLDQIMVLIAVERLARNTHRAKTKMPTFHDLSTIWKSGVMIRTQAMKFTMGTRGYVGSMIITKGQECNCSAYEGYAQGVQSGWYVTHTTALYTVSESKQTGQHI